MAKVGDAISLTVNGTKYAIPKDTEITIEFMGLKVKLSDSNRNTFNEARAKTDLPIVLQCVTKSYEMTGCIVGNKESTANRQITSDFECRCTDGSGIRES